MNIKLFFNMILLGLTLTTVFITLASYIIYKVRQVGSIKNNNDKIKKLDGVYFIRYSPEIEKENKKERDLQIITQSKKNKFPTLVYLSFFVFLIIILLLLTEHYIALKLYEEKRIITAENYLSLSKKGLLKSYDYDPYFKIQSKPYFFSNLNLSKYNFNIILMGHNYDFTDWDNYFKRYTNSNIENWESLKEKNCGLNSILIATEHTPFNSEQLDFIKSCIKNNAKIIFYENITPLTLNEYFNGELVSDNDETVTKYGTVTRSLDSLTGSTYNFKPQNYALKLINSGPEFTSIVRNAKYEGIPKNSNLITASRKYPKNIIWTAFGPREKEGNYELFDNLIINYPTKSINKSALHDKKIIYVAININSSADTLKETLKKLNKLELTPYLFIKEEELETYREVIDPNNNMTSSIGLSIKPSHFRGLSPHEIFSRLQEKRLIAEELTGSVVSNILIDDIDISDEIMSSIIQNRFKMVVGGKVRYLQKNVINDNTFHIGTTPNSIEKIMNTPSTGSDPAIISNLIKKEFDLIGEHNGNFILLITSKILSDHIAFAAIEHFITKMKNEGIELQPLNEIHFKIPEKTQN